MSFERPSQKQQKSEREPQPKREPMGSLIQKLAEGPVHGSGMSAYTPEQRVELEALLSNAGSSLDDPLLGDLPGESIVDIREYLDSPIGSVQRKLAAERFKAAYTKTKDEYYKEGA